MTGPLYKLTDQLAEFRDMESEFDPDTFADTLEAMQGDVEQKAIQVALFIQNLNAEADLMQAQIDIQQAEAARLGKRKSAVAKRIGDITDHLRTHLIRAGLGEKTISDPMIDIRWRKQPEKLGEFDEADVPSQFIEDVPATTKIDRRGLLAAAKADPIDGIPVVREPVKMVIK